MVPILDPKNTGSLTAGIVAIPETIPMKGGKIVKLRVAVPYAGTDKTSDDNRGFFDVVYYAREGETNAEFVLKQIESGNFKPGTTLQMIYRLNQERWEVDGKKGNKVVLNAEAISYATSPPKSEASAATAEAETISLPDSF